MLVKPHPSHDLPLKSVNFFKVCEVILGWVASLWLKIFFPPPPSSFLLNFLFLVSRIIVSVRLILCCKQGP